MKWYNYINPVYWVKAIIQRQMIKAQQKMILNILGNMDKGFDDEEEEITGKVIK